MRRRLHAMLARVTGKCTMCRDLSAGLRPRNSLGVSETQRRDRRSTGEKCARRVTVERWTLTVLAFKLNQKVGFESSRRRPGRTRGKSEAKGTVRLANPSVHSDVRTLRRTWVKVLAHATAQSSLICRLTDVRDIGIAARASMNGWKENYVDIRRFWKASQQLTFCEAAEK
jgi:hypothetical protein